jgi:hypothetical protein
MQLRGAYAHIHTAMARRVYIVWPYKASLSPCLALKQFPRGGSGEAAAANYLMHILPSSHFVRLLRGIRIVFSMGGLVMHIYGAISPAGRIIGGVHIHTLKSRRHIQQFAKKSAFLIEGSSCFFFNAKAITITVIRNSPVPKMARRRKRLGMRCFSSPIATTAHFFLNFPHLVSFIHIFPLVER